MDSEFHSVVETLMRQRPREGSPSEAVGSIAVLGAGPLGQALACAALAAGTRVRLFSAFSAELATLRERGAITVRGAALTGSYPVAEKPQRSPAIELVTTVDDAIREADVVLVAAPAWAHDIHAGLLGGLLTAEQTVVLVPGRFLGSVAFARILRRGQGAANTPVAELDAPPFLVSGQPGALTVHGAAEQLRLGALPSAEAGPLTERLRPVLPNLGSAPSVLETGFGGITALLRAAPAMLAASEIERGHAATDPVLLRDLVTPGLATGVLAKADMERQRVAFRYGVRELPSVAEQVALAFGGLGANLSEVVRSSEVFDEVAVPTGPGGGPDVADEVPYGLVPLTSAARATGVPTPVTDSLVGLASALAGTDFTREGRTMATLALDGVTPEDIRRLLDEPAGQPTAPSSWQVN